MLRMSDWSRIARSASFWLAAGAALLAVHDGAYLLEMGAGRALIKELGSAGHGYWPLASAILLALGLAVAAAWAGRIGVLAWRARHAAAGASGRSPGSWLSRSLRLWPRLLAVVLVAFLLQENVEHAAAHGHVVGFGALIGPEHPFAIPVLMTVTFFAALIAGGIRGHEEALLLRIAAARNPIRRPSGTIGPVRPRSSRIARLQPLADHRGLRAPPMLLLSS